MRPAISIAIGLLFVYLVCTAPCVTEGFSPVPYNAFGDPPLETMKEKDVKDLGDKFTNLIASANGTQFAISYHMDSLKEALETILNSLGFGRFKVISIGDTSPFTMNNVIIQNTSNLSIAKLERVDFIVTSSVPMVINKVIISPDKAFNDFRLPKGYAKDESEMGNIFQIKNPLHLFYPYKTSHNDMAITASEQKEFNDLVAQRERESASGVKVALPYAPAPKVEAGKDRSMMWVADTDGESTLREVAYEVR